MEKTESTKSVRKESTKIFIYPTYRTMYQNILETTHTVLISFDPPAHKIDQSYELVFAVNTK